MSERELDMWMAFLCAAYDGTPVTVERSKRGKIVNVEVHDTKSKEDVPQ